MGTHAFLVDILIFFFSRWHAHDICKILDRPIFVNLSCACSLVNLENCEQWEWSTYGKVDQAMLIRISTWLHFWSSLVVVRLVKQLKIAQSHKIDERLFGVFFFTTLAVETIRIPGESDRKSIKNMKVIVHDFYSACEFCGLQPVLTPAKSSKIAPESMLLRASPA